MTNKLVVIISSLKVPKIKKLLLYEMKYLLLPIYSCLQSSWLRGRGLPPPHPRSLCPQMNLLNSPSTKFLGPPLALSIKELPTFLEKGQCPTIRTEALGFSGRSVNICSIALCHIAKDNKPILQMNVVRDGPLLCQLHCLYSARARRARKKNCALSISVMVIVMVGPG